jgi:hypothetical protein
MPDSRLDSNSRTGICYLCHEQVCQGCGECRWCSGHLPHCKFFKVAVSFR